MRRQVHLISSSLLAIKKMPSIYLNLKGYTNAWSTYSEEEPECSCTQKLIISEKSTTLYQTTTH